MSSIQPLNIKSLILITKALHNLKPLIRKDDRISFLLYCYELRIVGNMDVCDFECVFVGVNLAKRPGSHHFSVQFYHGCVRTRVVPHYYSIDRLIYATGRGTDTRTGTGTGSGHRLGGVCYEHRHRQLVHIQRIATISNSIYVFNLLHPLVYRGNIVTMYTDKNCIYNRRHGKY